MTSVIKKIFVANRGEILRRICHSAKIMDIATCSYAESSDLDFIHGLLDEAVVLDHPLSTADYLNAAAIVQHAKQHGCDAVHPGFGFLSENADFARAVLKAGLLWIGPNPKAMDAMASKSSAQKIAEEHGVPCIPGCRGLFYTKNPEDTLKQAQNFIAQHGLPILIKAAMGGGGKGMRVVNELSTLKDSLERASSEALSAFGDDELIVQRYLPSSRHIEVQIMADQHGHVFVIGDRDCSLQRRHQKILEEAPAPLLSQATRRHLHDCARKLASAVSYDSAGTVEFLLDWTIAKESEQQIFYFLEMNTRLQVEHPVSEQVFGVDLVRAQISAALGQSLHNLLQQETLHPKGHSIEVRIYAEDPTNQFLPSPGKVWEFIRAEGPGIRWESGVEAGSEISTRFDPMIAKLIVWADTRERAIKRLAWALKNSFYAGPPSNFEYLTWLCEQSAFHSSAPATSYIAATLEQFQQDLLKHRHGSELFFKDYLPLQYLDGQTSEPSVNGDDRVAEIFSKGARASQPSADLQPKLQITSRWDRRHDKGALGRSLRGYLDREQQRQYFFASRVKHGETELQTLNFSGWYYQQKMERRAVDFGSDGGAANSNSITSPVPGKIIKVLVKPGQDVELQEKLMVLESMKMEYEISAKQSGTVETLLVQEGDQVSAAQTLITFSCDSNSR